MDQFSFREIYLISQYLNINNLRDIKASFSKSLMCSDSPLATVNNGNLITTDPNAIFGKDIQTIGKGAFGTVYKTIKNYAIKNTLKTPETLKEIALLHYLDHPNIMCIHGMFSNGPIISLAMDLAEEETLYYVSDKLKLSVDLRRRAYYQIFCALAYLHSCYIYHSDVKPSNILVFKTGTEYNFKLADFGLATTCTYLERPRSVPGLTLWWRPPEVLSAKVFKISSILISEKIDIWPMGIIMYDIIYQKNPGTSIYGHTDNEKMYNNIMSDAPLKSTKIRKDPYAKFDPEEEDLANQCLSKKPLDRPTAMQCLNHPFFKSILASSDIALITDNKKSEPPTTVLNYTHREKVVKYIYEKNEKILKSALKQVKVASIYAVTLADIYFSTEEAPQNIDDDIDTFLQKFMSDGATFGLQLQTFPNADLERFIKLSLKDPLNVEETKEIDSMKEKAPMKTFTRIMGKNYEEFKGIKTVDEYKERLKTLYDKIVDNSNLKELLSFFMAIAIYFVDSDIANSKQVDFTHMPQYKNIISKIINNLYISNIVQYYTRQNDVEPLPAIVNKMMEKLKETPDQLSIFKTL